MYLGSVTTLILFVVFPLLFLFIVLPRYICEDIDVDNDIDNDDDNDDEPP